MANQLGGSVISARAYSRHQRHRDAAKPGRIGSNQFDAFLAAQAARFTGGHTKAQVFAKLAKNSADRIKSTAAANFNSLA